MEWFWVNINYSNFSQPHLKNASEKVNARVSCCFKDYMKLFRLVVSYFLQGIVCIDDDVGVERSAIQQFVLLLNYWVLSRSWKGEYDESILHVSVFNHSCLNWSSTSCFLHAGYSRHTSTNPVPAREIDEHELFAFGFAQQKQKTPNPGLQLH